MAIYIPHLEYVTEWDDDVTVGGGCPDQCLRWFKDDDDFCCLYLRWRDYGRFDTASWEGHCIRTDFPEPDTMFLCKQKWSPDLFTIGAGIRFRHDELQLAKNALDRLAYRYVTGQQ